MKRFIDLGELLEQAGEDDLMKGPDVCRHFRVLGNRADDRFDFLADAQRMEFNLENVVQFPDFGSHERKDGLRGLYCLESNVWTITASFNSEARDGAFPIESRTDNRVCFCLVSSISKRADLDRVELITGIAKADRSTKDVIFVCSASESVVWLRANL